VAGKLSILLALPLLLAACGSNTTVSHTVTVRASTTSVRLDTLRQVAQRIYTEESLGTVDQGPLRSLERDDALMQAAAGGNAAATQRDAASAMAAAAHITGIRIVSGNRVLANTHLPFVVAGKLRGIKTLPGRQIEISIQDILGYVSLVHRVTGLDVVVHGSSGHALSSLPAATRAALPRSGRAQVASRSYNVVSFGEPGWAGERLTVWLLSPV